jgi:sulfoxide reductase catalytic subunit YedY
MNTENPPQPIKQEPITPKQLYLTRRKFLESVGIFSAGAFLAACMGNPPSSPSTSIVPADDMETRKDLALSYNNYYEFGTSKSSVAERAESFQMQPWQVEVGGLVKHPQTFSMEELLANFVQEERIYRMRCVEAWSMVLPWMGFPLAKLLEMAQPLPEAKFVAFQSVYRPEEMPGQVGLDFPWPYLEGLRLDEAQHPLTLLATGLYKEPLTPPKRRTDPLGGAVEVRLQERQGSGEDYLAS